MTIVRSIQHFGVYLVLKPFTVETDHKALTHLHSSTHLNGRLMWWALLLQPYTFTSRYCTGRENGNADGLSHQAWDGAQDEERDHNNLFKEGVMSGLIPDWLQSRPQRMNIINIIRPQTINTHRRKSEYP